MRFLHFWMSSIACDVSLSCLLLVRAHSNQTMYGTSIIAKGPGRPWICRSCLSGFSGRAATLKTQRRWIGLKVLAKRKKADEEWAAQAEAIEAGTKRHIWDIFEERGYIKDVAG